jgi:hypothetical protein
VIQNSSLPEKRRVLITAVREYEEPYERLPFCKKDGEAIYKVLKSHRYQILDNSKLVGRVKGNQIKEAIYDFFTDETINSEDMILFYYSGHGVPEVDEAV